MTLVFINNPCKHTIKIKKKIDILSLAEGQKITGTEHLYKNSDIAIIHVVPSPSHCLIQLTREQQNKNK